MLCRGRQNAYRCRMKPARALVLNKKGLTITIRILGLQGAGVVGHNVKINGLKTSGAPSRPPMTLGSDGANDLVFNLEEGQNTSVLKINSTCEITWE
jgi:hypothetical protein